MRDAAENGHAEAQYRSFQLLYQKASIYLRLAAEQNNTDALYVYGKHLFLGRFGIKDPKKGRECLMAAHYQKHPNAFQDLTNLEGMPSEEDDEND